MTITVRLNDDEVRHLSHAVRTLSTTKSQVVREAIRQYCEAKLRQGNQSPYDAIAKWVGCARSGKGDLSARAHERFREIVHEKRQRRSR